MDDHNLRNLGKASFRSIIALSSRTFVLQAIQTAAALIIFSVLAPADVGIFVAVIAIQRVISFFTDFGFGAALIQKKQEISQNDITTTFTLQAGVTLLIFITVFIFREQFTAYFNLGSQGQGLLLALVATIFISSFKTIPSILLERKIRFEKLIIPQIVESLVFNVLLIVLLLQGFRLDSYTYAFLVSSVITVPIYYFIAPWHIGLGINNESLKHLKFGLQFQAKNVLATIKDDLLTVILTKFLTFTEIGYIGFAQRISFMAYRYIVDSVTKVTFSTYSRIQEHTEVLTKAIEKSMFFTASLMFPVLAGLILTMPYFIQFIPQWNKWEPAVFSLIFFCLNAAVSSLSGILVNILDSTGRVTKTLKLMVIWTIGTWILTPILIFNIGYNGVALATFIISLTIVYTAYLVKQAVPFDFLKSIYKPSFCTLIMGIIVFAETRLFVTDLWSLGFVIALGIISYTVIYYLFAKKELMVIKKLLLKKYESEN